MQGWEIGPVKQVINAGLWNSQEGMNVLHIQDRGKLRIIGSHHKYLHIRFHIDMFYDMIRGQSLPVLGSN